MLPAKAFQRARADVFQTSRFEMTRALRPGFACAARMLWGGLATCTKVSEAVLLATRRLRAADVPEAKASAEWLAISVFQTNGKCSRAMIRNNDAQPSLEDLAKYAAMCRDRAKRRTPVQYLVGEWDFHNVILAMRAPVLIPRPETEELVELALDSGANLSADLQGSGGGLRVLDVGCGSGAIIIALLAAQPTWTGIGLDISEAAVKLSRENALSCGVASRCSIVRAGIADWFEDSGKRFDMIVSNPPYIPARDMLNLPAEVAQHEDGRALAGGGEDGLGLAVIRAVLGRASGLLRPGGRVLLEVDPTQPALIEEASVGAVEWAGGLCYIRTVKDMYGLNRFCELEVVGGGLRTANICP
jgi:release factor glutamine methyltransferase